MSNLVLIQKATAEHKHFIKATWLKNFCTSAATFLENIDTDIYYKNHSDLFEKLWTRCDALVAQSAIEPELTVGYIVYEKNTVHYVYVRHNFYRFGIARKLFEESKVNPDDFTYTHRNRNCRWLVGYIKRLEEKNYQREYVPGIYPKGKYNPYLFLRGGE